MNKSRKLILHILGLIFLVSAACNLTGRENLPTATSPGIVPSPVQPSPTPLAESSPSSTHSDTPAPAQPNAGETALPSTEAAATPESSPAPEVPQVVAVQNLNVRDGPGTYYLVVGRLAKDQRAVVIGQANPFGARWWKIQCPPDSSGGSCWVTSGAEFIREIDVDSVPQAEVPPTPLRRNDVPPEGVAAQLGNFIPGAGCQGTLFVGGEEQLGQVEILQSFPVCLDGFTAGAKVRIRVFQPNGDRIAEDTVQTPELGNTAYEIRILPGQPFGEYSIEAREGDLVAKGVFNVVAATERRIYVTPVSGKRDTTFRVAVAGFENPPRLFLYRLANSGDFPYQYMTSLGKPTLDERGEGFYNLRIAPDDPLGEYVVSLPNGKVRARFTITD